MGDGGCHPCSEGVGEFVDDGAEAAIKFDFGVEHVLDDTGHKVAGHETPEVAGVEEGTSLAEFVEGVCHAGEVEGDVWSDEFDIEGDDLLFEY